MNFAASLNLDCHRGDCRVARPVVNALEVHRVVPYNNILYACREIQNLRHLRFGDGSKFLAYLVSDLVHEGLRGRRKLEGAFAPIFNCL